MSQSNEADFNQSISTPECATKSTEVCEITAPHICGGHTFLVTTVTEVTEEVNKLRAVPVPSTTKIEIKNVKSESTQTSLPDSNSGSSTKAIVPLSSSLPSKLLRLHAKRSAQALLAQSQSLDSQFGSDEGATGGNSEYESSEYDMLTPTAPPMSPQPGAEESLSAADEKLIDVGMGSSIDDSEESEEDDELKPLAVDNHMLLNAAGLSSPISERSATLSPEQCDTSTSVLSEANLEKFRKHHHHHSQSPPQPYLNMDNIYLHPNFKYEEEEPIKDMPEASPPPAVAPANSPVEQKRVHRSFLTMKKPVESGESTTAASFSTISPPNTPADTTDGVLVNEIDTLDPALIPNDELAAEIAEAVEFYFSNESILKDAFLLKHVRRNKEGFVSLKLVSSFKRVRQLTKEWKVVGNAVRRKSRKIELNDIGTKVRRLEPLPNFDETMPSRTIVACDLPLDKLTIEKVSDIFSKCGEIALIRILKPGMAIPVDVRQFMNKYPEMQQKECALVEFLESASAREAKYLQGPFQVFDMVAPKKKTGKKAIIQIAAPVARMVENYRYYNDATYERTRGGSFSGIITHDIDPRYKLKRNNTEYPTKTYASEFQHGLGHNNQYNSHSHSHSHHHHHHSPTHRGSFGSDHHVHQFQHYQPRGSISSHESSHSYGGTSPGSNNNGSNNNSNSNNMSFFAYSPRRYSNTSTISANTAALAISPTRPTATVASDANNNNMSTLNANNTNNSVRRLSNCSETYSNFSEHSGRRPSNCSEHVPAQRRDSLCSETCPCSRRVSEYGQTEAQRKTSQSSICSGGERRFSNGSMQFERTFSNASDSNNNNINNNNINSNNAGFPRRMSNDFNFERKQSLETHNGSVYDDGNVGGGGGGYNVFPRRYSNNFNAANKLAAYDNAQYINGRRISTDSGYDRRYSFGSEYEGSPRSRTSSFLSNYKHGGNDYDGQPRSRTGSFIDGSPRSRSGSFAQRNAENLVRTPLGPVPGSKGFGDRARKMVQTISPVN